MQNIPSKHSDIRHMFRATPEQDEKVKFDDTLNLFSVDSIQIVKDNEPIWVYAKDLKIDDIIYEGNLQITSLTDEDASGHIMITVKEVA